MPELKTMPNVVFVPDPSTLHPLSWAGGDDFRVAEVLGTTYMALKGPLNPYGSRGVVAKLLERLDALGITVLTGTEVEFRMLESDSRDQLFTETGCSLHSFSLQENLLFHMESNLHSIGIDIETMYAEIAPDMFEFTIKPHKGIKAIDDVFLFKTSIKEMTRKMGVLVSFVPVSKTREAASTIHFNISLWDKQGKNILHDKSQNNQLSVTALHWIAGLVKHAGALTALCSPTVNCYRRFLNSAEPKMADWGLDNRSVAFRVKNNGEQGTYIENRLPSSLANPYLAMAVTLAAGLDGIENQLKCPPMEDKEAKPIPANLSEALLALENDVVVKDLLGEDLISTLVDIKKECEIAKFPSHDVKKDNDAEVIEERVFYEKLM